MTSCQGLRWPIYFLSLASMFALLAVPTQAGEPVKKSASSEQDIAHRIDQTILQSLEHPTALPPRADDETFLRRVCLDLTGKLPTPEKLHTFLSDRDPAKRTKEIDRLLASQDYAVNWGRYWRDTLTYHTPASGNYLRWQLFDAWMVEQIRKNRPWGEIVTALVTSTGVNDECAPVNFMTALYGNPVEIAATTSRVFMGVQLQCAECHDAKTESWKRVQFHELVAFFGRAKIIQHKDVNGRGTPYAIEGREDGQYSMTDKKDPKHLISMSPRFLTGASIQSSATDRERREALARFLTDGKNPWFARAYVNRMWSSLMGWGFYPTVTDLGSAKPPQFPAVLDLLAHEWTATGFDMHWLFRTLALTQAYQRHIQPRPTVPSSVVVAVCPSRLRPEQVFESMTRALGFDENDKTIPAPAVSTAPAVSRHTGLRHMIYQAFKVDPSLSADEVHGTIPQALLMMNSVLVNSYVAASSKGCLTDALKKGETNDLILNELYERTLARKPRSAELTICHEYLKKVGDRKEALEDIYWSLINSTEFLTRK